MFFSLFLNSVNSIYVPFSDTDMIFYDAYTDRQFTAILKKQQFVVAALLDSSSDRFEANIETFSKLPTIFSEEVKFCVLTSQKARKSISKYGIGSIDPEIAFFLNGEHQYTIPFPTNELELMTIVDVFLRPETPLLNTEEQVMQAITDTTITIITIPQLLAQSKQIAAELSRSIGSFSIIQTKPEVLKKMGYSGTKPCVYRKTDKVIQEIEDPAAFISRSIPSFYPKFSEDLLDIADRPVAILIVENKPTKEQKEKMAELGEKFDSFIFTIANKSIVETFQHLDAFKVREYPSFFIADQNSAFFFPVQKFDNNVDQYIQNIISGKVDKILPSEPIPTKQEDPWVEKVVGKNYLDFVNDPTKDVVMFYLEEDLDGLRAAHKFGKYVKKNHIDDIKVGYINIDMNTVDGPFPHLVFSPQVNVFPKKDKVPDYINYGSLTVYSLIEAVRRFTDNKLELNKTVFRFELELRYLVELVQDLSELEPAEKASAEDFIIHRGKQLGFGSSLDGIIQAVYRAAGGLVSGYDGANEINEFEEDDDDFIQPYPGEDLPSMKYPEGGHHHHHHHGGAHYRV